MPKVAVIVVAAGKGTRFSGHEKKALAKIDGRPLFLRALDPFMNRDDVCQTILVVSPEDKDDVRERFGANLGFMGVQLAVGGANRPDSVAAGLAMVKEEAELIAIHDGARPCACEPLIDAVFAEAAKTGAAILAAQLRGTIKRAGESRVVDETVSRQGLWEAQTPQVFRRDVILKAYERRAEFEGELTDDAQLVEVTGHPVMLVESDFTNLKVTVKADLTLAASVLKILPKPRPKGPAMGVFEEAQW